ncbi:MAG TPA: branched-chain amino acid ABC transporter substrate-binding protein [Burkholderiaceae bacterium]|jgi:branched-chain amino acid transport system substrate-binding protein|nr:branched-chain amino acid ABC transporter substrate-binding protein [Burkholderiaceae bacterium]
MNPLLRTTYTVLAIALLAGCSRQIDVKIGLAMPMTGPLAQFGKDSLNGAQVAVDELNNEHFTINGRRAHFELVVADDKSDPEAGKVAAQTLIDDKVNGVFGDLNSGVTIPASALYAKAGIPQMSVSTNPKYTRQGFKTAFRILADDILQGTTIGLLMTDKLHAKSIYMLDDGTPFGVGLADEVTKVLKAKNITAAHDSLNPKALDLPALLQKIKDSKADVVFFGGDEGTGLPLIKALRKDDTTIKFVAADALCDQSTIKHAAGDLDSNFYCTIAGVPPSWLSAGAGFTQVYTAKFGPPGAYSIPAYDGIHIFAQAMQEANSSDPAVYLPFLAKGSFDGKIQGSVEFDAKGDVKDGTVVIYQAIGGQLVEQRSLL